MTTPGIDYFTRLMANLEALAARQTQAQGLFELAEALMRVPPESEQRIAYNAVMDHAADLHLGASLAEVERDHVEDYCANYRDNDDPGPFLENLIADIDNLIDDAERSADDAASGHPLEATDGANPKANEIARGIACKKAADGAREAAEEAYRLAYQWAYEDIFAEAYRHALNQLAEAV